MSGDHDEKLCTKCDIEKPVSEFYSKPDRGDGMSAYCRSCIKGIDKTPEARNRTSRRKRWADGTFLTLHLTGRDY